MGEPHTQPPERHDWEILDALSDDYESVEQITSLVRHVWPSVTQLEIIDRLERLYGAVMSHSHSVPPSIEQK